MGSDNKKSVMAPWQSAVKRSIDIVAGITGLVLLSPLMLYAAIRVKCSSPGRILYSQERVGRSGELFIIHKFRSMCIDAEPAGPMLSARNDARITPWGRSMRRWKIDELPQLWNVILGDMSIVGPRPERQFYIRQLEATMPVHRLLEVRPGLTSLGMVRCGYAETIPEMIERMQHDLFYLGHFSLGLDLKIMLKTIRIIFNAKNR